MDKSRKSFFLHSHSSVTFNPLMIIMYVPVALHVSLIHKADEKKVPFVVDVAALDALLIGIK